MKRETREVRQDFETREAVADEEGSNVVLAFESKGRLHPRDALVVLCDKIVLCAKNDGSTK